MYVDIVKPIYEPLNRRAALRANAGRLRAQASPEMGRFTDREVTKLLDAGWGRYDAAVGSLKAQPTLSMSGSTLVVAVNALMLKRTKLAGIREAGKTDMPQEPVAGPAQASSSVIG